MEPTELRKIVLSDQEKKVVENAFSRAKYDIEYRTHLMENATEEFQSLGVAPEMAEALGTLQSVTLEDLGLNIGLLREGTLDNGNGKVLEHLISQAGRGTRFR
jgi:hypothetical protein